ncbi:MAG: hypothetical protein QGM50_01465 [Anaerolineae bacterium]|nr:hypothetical protein [Anaerolineae bacterium]MDK1080561.1 hypothetical protein [Anaerolineae bacterium]MDK1117436.1 hypothetical protein [Anaerolineae bacterium]
MLKPVRWNTFLRDLFVIQIGFLLYGLAIALAIRANLGTGTWAVLDVALSNISGWSVGTLTILTGLVVLVIALIMREQIGWGTLANVLSIGNWLNLALWVIPSIEAHWPLQVGMLLVGILVQGAATAIYIGVNAGAGPRDSMMLAITRTTGASTRLSRGMMEAFVLVIGWLLGGPFGIGTIVHVFLMGSAIQWAFKIFRVQPPRKGEPKIVAVDSSTD